MTETPCCAYHAGRTEGMLVACQVKCSTCGGSGRDGVRGVSYPIYADCIACGGFGWRPRPAAAVPEAQHGREGEQRLRAALTAAGDAIESFPPDQRHAAIEAAWAALDGVLSDPAKARTFLVGVMVVAHDRAQFPDPSAAVREGEREQLAKAIEAHAGPEPTRGSWWTQGYHQAMREAAAVLPAAPSHPAPEGTEQ